MKFNGINVSPGIAIGKAHVYRDDADVNVSRYKIDESGVEEEVRLFRDAVSETISDIKALHARIAGEIGEEQAKIIEAQLVFLEDRYLAERTIERIRNEKENAAYVFSKVIDETAESFSSLDSHYLRGRVEDIRYIGRSVLKKMTGADRVPISEIKGSAVIIARDLSPADTAMMKKEKVLAFVTEMGSRTSHTAIMARSIGIPAVVGLKEITLNARSGDTVIVDGNSGDVVVNPSAEEISLYEGRRKEFLRREESLGELARLPAQTIDGREIKLMANIEMPAELDSVVSHGAGGIGLYRTEFLYLNRKNLPGEQEQFEAYREVISRMAPARVIIRTVDLGGDKFASAMELPSELNPFMGWRGIRFCLEQPDIFTVQLRAILRAAAEGSAGIMFPLVSCLEEYMIARTYLDEAAESLRKERVPHAADIETGVMIETPSAAMIADILAEEADFFSIGTNDLIQYSMAVDRINEKVAHLYRPAHPGILRMIKSVVDAGHSKNIRVDMCGEMAGEDKFIIILLGMGIDGLSMSPVALPQAKKLIRSMTYGYAKKVAARALELSTSDEVDEMVKSAEPGPLLK